MAATLGDDPAFTYHNPYKNSIFVSRKPTSDMSDLTALQKDPSLQSFTATGRPFNPAPKVSAFVGMAGSESWGSSVPALLPVRFTDNSIISVPVMPPSDFAGGKSVSSDENDDEGPVRESKPTPRFSFSAFRRKSSSSKHDKKVSFVMKDMTRAEYLKHYAKDENGNYIGTEDAAIDCILNNEKDRTEKRKAAGMREAFANMSGAPNMGFT